MDYMKRIINASSKKTLDTRIGNHSFSKDISKKEYLKTIPYSQIKNKISISIQYFNFGTGDDYVYKGIKELIGINNNEILILNDNQKALYKDNQIENLCQF